MRGNSQVEVRFKYVNKGARSSDNIQLPIMYAYLIIEHQTTGELYMVAIPGTAGKETWQVRNKYD